MQLTQEIKDWFGDGEIDIDLMLQLGVIKEENILQIYMNDPESPYNKQKE